MRALLVLAAAGEAATGIVLLVHPPVVVWLLFGAEVSGAGMVMSRVAGMSIFALGIACWPGREPKSGTLPLLGMLTYSSLAALYLASLGVGGYPVGKLLWPAVVVHAVLSLLLARAWLEEKRAQATRR